MANLLSVVLLEGVLFFRCQPVNSLITREHDRTPREKLPTDGTPRQNLNVFRPGTLSKSMLIRLSCVKSIEGLLRFMNFEYEVEFAPLRPHYLVDLFPSVARLEL